MILFLSSKGDIQPNLEKIRTCSFFAWIDCIKYLEPPKSFVKLNSMGKTQGGHALFAQLGKNANSAPEGRRDFSNTPKCTQWSHLYRCNIHAKTLGFRDICQKLFFVYA